MNVLSDAQVSVLEVVRPIENFESVYQGKAGTTPIAFPGTLDPLAGQPGYAANLLKGIPVPFGGRVFVQIPMTVDGYTSQPIYGYQFIWRVRNHQSYLQTLAQGRQGAPYHLATDDFGRREVQGSPSSNLYFIPGSSDIEIFEQAEPVGAGAATLTMRQQIYVPELANSWTQPLTPQGLPGVWQQGTYQFSNNVNCSGPSWFPLWLDVAGDELLILAYKTNSAAAWDFATTDKAFSNTYGNDNGGLPNNPNIGILIGTGTMGS